MSQAARAMTADQPELRDELQAHGVIVSHTPVYEWNGFRYSNAHDALAAAKRGR